MSKRLRQSRKQDKREQDISLPSTWLLPLDVIVLISSFILPEIVVIFRNPMHNIEGVVGIIKLSQTCKQLHKKIIKLFRREIIHRTVYICDFCDVFYKYERYRGNGRYIRDIINCDYCM